MSTLIKLTVGKLLENLKLNNGNNALKMWTGYFGSNKIIRMVFDFRVNNMIL